MDILRLSQHFEEFRNTEEWKEFDAALKKLIESPASARFQVAVAPATKKLDLGDYFNLLAGFVRETQASDPDMYESTARLSYSEVYEYDDRPRMTFNEDPTEASILIGNNAFRQTISLFTLERASMKLRFGRAILEGISRLDQLNNSLDGTGHRLRLSGSNIEMPIQFYNVVSETDKYSGEKTTYCDFYLLWPGEFLPR